MQSGDRLALVNLFKAHSIQTTGKEHAPKIGGMQMESGIFS